MKNKKIQALYQKAINKWGVIPQIQMTIEECAELIVVLAKSSRFKNGSTVAAIIEELVDVEIMVEQMKLMLSHPDYNYCESFDIVKERKLKRLERLLNDS